MKRLFLLLTLFAACTFSCQEEKNIETPDTEEPEIPVEPEKEIYSLEDFSSENYPTFDDWVIDDKAAIESEFKPLRDAIIAVSTNEPKRKITLSFPNLLALPSKSLYCEVEVDGDKRVASNNVTSISLPVVDKIGEAALYAYSNLETISAPKMRKLGFAAFSNCSKLTKVDLSNCREADINAIAYCSSLTEIDLPYIYMVGENLFSGTPLETLRLATKSRRAFTSFGYNVFDKDKGSEAITLYLGEINEDFINKDGVSMTIGNVEWGKHTFKEIVVVPLEE